MAEPALGAIKNRSKMVATAAAGPAPAAGRMLGRISIGYIDYSRYARAGTMVGRGF
jgi:hypothetical protein